MSDFHRTDRIASEVQRELSQLLRSSVKDPRINDVSITAVRVTRDLGHAKIYFLVPEGVESEEVQQVLNRAANFLRNALGKALQLRVVPKLTFFHDDSIANGVKLTALIEKAVAKDADQ